MMPSPIHSHVLHASAGQGPLSGQYGTSKFAGMLDSARQLNFEHGAETAMSKMSSGNPLTAGDLLGKGARHVVPPPAMHQLKATDLTPAARQKANLDQMHPLISGVSAVAHGRAVPTDADIEKQAQRWVSQTFFGTLLKQMHESPFKSDLFSGGRGGKAFEPMMDQHLADRMSRGSGKKLVRSIVKQLKNRSKHRESLGLPPRALSHMA